MSLTPTRAASSPPDLSSISYLWDHLTSHGVISLFFSSMEVPDWHAQVYNGLMQKQKPHKPRFFRKHYAIPNEHGIWIWWLGPLIIGTSAAGGPSSAFLTLFLAALFGFLIRQPVSIIVKALSGRRNMEDVQPAAFWVVVYGLGLLLSVGILGPVGCRQGILLAIPGIPVFIWNIRLISKRAERGQRGIELVGSGVLALAAPAAYWVSGGTDIFLPWILWLLTWLQSAASIVNVYDRLEFRKLDQFPSLGLRLRNGRRSLAYHIFNVILSAIFAVGGWIPWLSVIAFALMLLDSAESVLHPPIGAKARAIGFRQLGASILFVILMSMGFLLTGTLK